MDVRALVKQLDDAAESVATLSEHEKIELQKSAQNLIWSAETYRDIVYRTAWSPLIFAAIRIADNMDLFRILHDSDQALSSKELAERTKSDPTLLDRILRALASQNIIKESGNDGYASTRICEVFSVPKLAAGMRIHWDLHLPAWQLLPEYLKKRNHQEPDELTNTPFHQAFDGVGMATWEIMARYPKIMEDFNLWMSGINVGRAAWTDVYPAEERIVRGLDKGSVDVAFVDVGGGQGHQAIEFKKKYPNMEGRIIVQDLPKGMKGHDTTSGVEFQVQDFFQEQSIKGARVYYLRYILHDYPDSSAEIILKHIHKALDPHASRLIINEWMVPERGASWAMSAQDLNMLSMFTSKERTEAQWRSLLTRNGYDVVEVFRPDDKISECVIEAKRSS